MAELPQPIDGTPGDRTKHRRLAQTSNNIPKGPPTPKSPVFAPADRRHKILDRLFAAAGLHRIIGLNGMFFERDHAGRQISIQCVRQLLSAYPTLRNHVNRAMSKAMPRTLSADDVHALTAYIPGPNDPVPHEFVADRNSLPKVKMRRRDNFTWTDPRPDTMARPRMTGPLDTMQVK